LQTELKKVLIRKINQMDCLDRMELLNKYTAYAENIYCNLPKERISGIIGKILQFKFDKQAMIEGLSAGEPIVDRPGYRLADFLIAELEWI
jgi:hypothetical protein